MGRELCGTCGIGADAPAGGANSRASHEGIGARAQEGGRSGARIFVDSSRRYLASGRAKEWFDFESWLGRRLQARVGLVCAYRRQDVMRPEILPEVLRTHGYRFDSPN